MSLSTFGYPLTNFSTGEHPSQFVFLTAADSNHLHEWLDAVARIQSFFPQHLVYVYDLSETDGGLLAKHSHKVCFTHNITYPFINNWQTAVTTSKSNVHSIRTHKNTIIYIIKGKIDYKS